MDTDTAAGTDASTDVEIIDKNERKLKSKKVKGEVLDLQNGAAFLSGVKIRGGTGLFFALKNPSPGINDAWSGQDQCVRGNLAKTVLLADEFSDSWTITMR